MARYSRYQKDKEEEEERRPRRRPVKAGPPMVPILALLVVIAGAIVLARMASQNEKPEEPEREPVKSEEIFGDLPVEEPPVRGGGGGRGATNRAPSGLANNAVWIKALKTADEAAAILAEATQARNAGDHSAWNEKGNAAKDLYNQALEATALWEEELQEEYGDTDRQVRKIMSIRTKWFDKLTALHKTTGR